MSAPPTLRRAVPSLVRVLSRVRPYLRPQRRVLASSFAALLVAVALRLLEPWPLKVVFDEVIARELGMATGNATPGWGLRSDLLLLLSCAALVALEALRAGAQYLNRVGFARVGNAVVGKLRQELFAHLQDLSLSFHDRSRTGDKVLRVIGDVNQLRDVAVTALLPQVASSLTLVAMWAVMVWMDWRLTLLAASVLPLAALRGAGLSRRIHEAARKQRRHQGELATAAAEAMASIKNVQALSLEGAFLERFGAKNRSSGAQDVKTARLSASLGRTVDVLLALATALVLGFGARLVLSGRITPGELLVFLTYLRRAFTPVQDLAKYSGRLAKAAAAGERVLELLDRAPEVADAPHAVPAPRLRGAIELRKVSFSYDEGPRVLKDLDLKIEPGSRVALVGPSGIGKSTVLDLVLRLRDPQGGSVTIDGRDIRDFTRASLRSQIAVVLQDSLLFSGSVRDNIALAADYSDGEIETAASVANAHEFVIALPHGYDTVIGERGVTLSGGEQQRITIARAAARRAPILVLDEPTTGLDATNRQAVTEALWRLADGRTTMIVSHDLELCAQADRILYLEDGRIVESGTHDALLALSGRYARLYRLQAAAPTKVVTA